MSTKIKRKRSNIDVEKLILITLITSDDYCKKLVPILDVEVLKVETSRLIAHWIIDYFLKFKQAPKENIKEIYYDETEYLDEEQVELIHETLSHLSDKFDEEKNKNIEYIFRKTIKYLDRRSLEKISSDLNDSLERGNVRKARELLNGYKKVSKSLSQGLTFDIRDETIEGILLDKFDPEKAHPDDLFQLEGRFGEFFGMFRRKWVLAILAGFKKGKTWGVNELAICAAMNRLNVTYVTFDMSKEDAISRLMDRVTAIPNAKSGEFIFPVFDCLKNQEGTCHKSKRIGHGKIIEEGKLGEYEDNEDWIICNECRGNKDYIHSTWKEIIIKNQQTYKHAKGKLEAFRRMFGSRIKIHAFPRNGATLAEVESAMDNDEFIDGFIPDVLDIDYLDVTKCANPHLSGRDISDAIWKEASGLASRRNLLLITPVQGNKISRKKKWIEEDDVSEDQRKFQHAEMAIGLNQTDEEKELGIMRYNAVISRHTKMVVKRGVTVLQNLDLGQTHLDSEF